MFRRAVVTIAAMGCGCAVLMLAAGCGGDKTLAAMEVAPASRCVPAPSPLVFLVSTQGCDKCRDTLLPGRAVPLGESDYTLWSDLPEVFCSPGVLYATTDVLPGDANGKPPATMRRQTRDMSFAAIDGAFDVFIFHTVYGCPDASPRRVVVYVRNDGDDPVVLLPRQIISTEGVIGRIHEMESTLGRRVMEGDWDVMTPTIRIEPGNGDVVAWSKRFSMPENGPDASRNVNCFGRVRVEVGDTSQPELTVYVVGIDAAPLEENRSRAAALLQQAAVSGEKHISFDTPPTGCEVRRATGVFRSFLWRNDPMVLDVAALSGDGVAFPMALWNNVTQGCPEASQTVDLLLHPPYNRGDTIGNYMVDYRVQFQMANSSVTESKQVDVKFGKSDADIGLAWRVASSPEFLTDSMVDAQPVRTGWAGPKQGGITRSFLEREGGPITLRPCETRNIGLRFMVLGNSSLPFDLRIEPAAAGN